MKKILILTLIFILGKEFSYSQNEEKAKNLFSRGNALYELVFDDIDFEDELQELDTLIRTEKIKYNLYSELKYDILDHSLANFERIIEKHQESILYHKALTNAGLIAFEINEFDKAEKYFKQIVNGDSNDNEKGGLGSGLMREPYALYKNRACQKLASIYIKTKKFDEALKYLKLTRKYKYKHYCGNEIESYNISIATLYTKCYIGKKNYDKAFNYCLPRIFYNGLASNSEILSLSISLIKKVHSNTEIRRELEKAINSVTIKKRKNGNTSYITFLNRKIELPDENLIYPFTYETFEKLDKLNNIEKSIEIFKMSNFYKELIQNSP